MKIKLLTTLVFLISIQNYAQSVEPTIEVTDSENNKDILVDCDYPLDADKCFTLKANYTKIQETSSYEVKSIPFKNLTGLTQDKTITISKDDTWSDVFDLPFKFCFYNKTYDKLIIGDNGVISFDIDKALSASVYSAAKLPNPGLHNAAIYGAFHDITNSPNVKGCAVGQDCGQIKTYISGVAPNRSFVVSYENMNHFNCDQKKSTLQIVIYETSNLVEVYVKEKSITCEEKDKTSKYRRNALIGIQNETGTEAVTAPDRNSGEWTATKEAWQFVPNGGSLTVVEWQDKDGTKIGTGEQIKVCPKASTSYKAVVTYDVCVGEDITLEDSINVKIDKDFPIATDNEITVCDENINLTTYEKLIIGEQEGLALSYYTTMSDASSSVNPITNLINYKLTKPQEVFYVRLDRGASCFDIGELKVNLRVTPVSNLSKIIVCDKNNDDEELVELSEYNSAIIKDQKNVQISYYETSQDAKSKANPIEDINVKKTASVFVRLELNPNGGCPNITEIPISLTPVPEVKPIDVTLCSNIAIYDLTQHEKDVLTENNPTNLQFSYHLYESWADSNTNPFTLTDPENPIDPKNYKLDEVAEIWVRTVTDNGCHDVFPIKFTYKQGVEVKNDLQVSTGTIFDLKESINNMVTDLTDIEYHFYKTSEGAQNQDENELIEDIDNFEATNPDTKVYVVFTNKKSGCKTVGELGLEPGAGFGGSGGGGGGLQVCDFGNDLTEEVTLSDYDADLITGYDFKDHMTVTYYNTKADAQVQTSPITAVSLTAPKTIFARISLNNTKEEEINHKIVEVELDFKATGSVNEASTIMCDALYDNKEEYDLTLLEKTITTDTSATFSYSDGGVEVEDPTKFTFSIPSGKTEKEVDVTVALNGCDLKTKIKLSFYPEIETKEDAKYSKCDLLGDGKEFIDLSNALSVLVDDSSKYNSTYYEADERGNLSTVQITNFTVYEVTEDKLIYVKFEDEVNKCTTTEKLQLNLVSVPSIKKNKLAVCDYGNNNEEQKKLTEFDKEILGNQRDLKVLYFLSESDSNNDDNAIDTLKLTGDKTIYVKLFSEDATGCVTKGAVDIVLNKSPDVKDVNVTVCDNYTDGEEIYDLSLSEDAIVENKTDYTFKYYSTETDAISDDRAVSKDYNIKSVPQTLYARTTRKDTGCFSVSKITLNFTIPVNVNDTELNACDNDSNLSEEFNLVTAIPKMLADTTGYTIKYYASKTAAEEVNSAFEITTPKKYDTKSEDDTVYVRFFNDATGCFSVGKIALKTLAIPKLVRDSYEICDTDFDTNYTLNLPELKPLIIKDYKGLDFSYFTSKADAENATNEIKDTMNYVVPKDKHMIYIRVKNKSECWSYVPVTIKFGQKIAINTVTDVLETCGDINGFANFDLTSFASKITTESGVSFQYYETEEDTKKQQSAITTPSNYKNSTANEQLIYVRVSVADKCDAITSFKIRSVKIVSPSLQPISICKGEKVVLDAGSVYASYQWSTSETTQTIEVSKAGTYTVKLTDSKGCQGEFEVVVTENPVPNVSLYEVEECHTSEFKTFNLTDYKSKLTDDATHKVEFYLSKNNLDSGLNSLNSSFTNTSNPQTIYVKVINDLGCHSVTELKLNVVQYPEKPKVETPLSYTYDEEASSLKADVDVGNSLKWYADDGSDLGLDPIPSTTTVGETNYWVSQINSAGCESDRAKIVVNVSKAPIQIYNEFSPNEDGYNDSFRVEHIEMYPDNKVEVFNRFGTLVFTMNGYTNDSDKSFKGVSNVQGEFLGNKLVVGVYFYLVDLGNGSEPKRGWLSINR